MFTSKGFLVFLSAGAMALSWTLPAEADSFQDYTYVSCLGKGMTSVVVEARKANGSHVALKLFKHGGAYNHEKKIVETISELRTDSRTPNFLEYLGSHDEMTGTMPKEYQEGNCRNPLTFMNEQIGDIKVKGVIEYTAVRSMGNNWEKNKCWDLMMVHAFLMFRKYLSFTHGDFTQKNLLPSEWPNDVKHMCFGYKSDTEERLTCCVSKNQCKDLMPVIIDYGESEASGKGKAPYNVSKNDASNFMSALSESGKIELGKDGNTDLTKMFLNSYFESFKDQLPQGLEGEVVYYGD